MSNNTINQKKKRYKLYSVNEIHTIFNLIHKLFIMINTYNMAYEKMCFNRK